MQEGRLGLQPQINGLMDRFVAVAPATRAEVTPQQSSGEWEAAGLIRDDAEQLPVRRRQPVAVRARKGGQQRCSYSHARGAGHGRGARRGGGSGSGGSPRPRGGQINGSAGGVVMVKKNKTQKTVQEIRLEQRQVPL